MATSCIEASEAALVTLLRAASGLSGVQVEKVHPGKAMKQECVFIGDTEFTQEHRSLGSGGAKSEEFTTEVWVVVHQRGNDGQAVKARARVLAAVVESVIRSNQNLGLVPPTVLTLTAEFKSGRQENYVELEGRTCQVRCDVSVSARI